MKKAELIKKLNQIKNVSEATGIEGLVYLPLTGMSVKGFDDLIGSITEFPKRYNNISFGKLEIKLFLE